MPGQIRYTNEFKIDALAQVTERGYSCALNLNAY